MTTKLQSLTKHLSPGVGRLSQLILQRGAGSWVWDHEGHKYLDLTTGIGVVNTGHCHPTVVKAAQEQCNNVVHSQANISHHDRMLELCDRLLPIVPNGLDCFFFGTTGSEATENAVKLARHATGKPNVIAFQGGYHGRTVGAMSMTTSKTIYRAGFGPLMPGVSIAPFPYLLQSPCRTEEECVSWALEQVELIFKQQSAPSETAAIIIEPILGEGGYVPAPKGYLQSLKKMCEEKDVLFIADEVQSGFGRTGEYFSIKSHFEVEPDILCMAKGLASGFPLSAIASSRDLMSRQPPGSMGGTYSGNPVACAAAIATISVIEEENLLQNARDRGKQLTKGLSSLAETYPIGEIRGRGLMVGLEFDKSVKSGTATAVSKACLKNGMLLLTASVFESLRFIPALNISPDEIDTALHIFGKALKEVF